VSGIRVSCQGCGREVDSGECEHLRCRMCMALADAAPHLAQYERQWAKRLRYARAGVSLAPIDAALVRLQGRIASAVMNRLRDPELASQTWREAIERAQERARGVASRLVLPRPGAMIEAVPRR